MNTYYVYILSSAGGHLYIGVSNDLSRRLYEHKEGLHDGFTKKYQMHKLVYYESSNDIQSAIEREKRLKWWPRKWKVKLIESMNPEWKNLAEEWTESA